jgi:hypothetical protein
MYLGGLRQRTQHSEYAIGWTVRGSNPGVVGKRFYSSPHPSKLASEPTQPPVEWALGLSSGGKASAMWR